MIIYAIKLKHGNDNRILQRGCLERQLEGKMYGWGETVSKKVEEMGLQDIWKEGYKSVKVMKRIVKEKRKVDIIFEIETRKSLTNYKKPGDGGCYLGILKRQERGAME